MIALRSRFGSVHEAVELARTCFPTSWGEEENIITSSTFPKGRESSHQALGHRAQNRTKSVACPGRSP